MYNVHWSKCLNCQKRAGVSGNGEGTGRVKMTPDRFNRYLIGMLQCTKLKNK